MVCVHHWLSPRTMRASVKRTREGAQVVRVMNLESVRRALHSGEIAIWREEHRGG